ncbi:MAG: protein-L-isoaspartate(D-aspartate) O-methyltransferase [Burkholderiales bacterium]|nr:protein-L-isoaspartate(D-aspartate) O-methyltransferase [Burkholderiales bacterium]
MSESESQPKKRFPLTLDFVTGLSGRSKAADHRTRSTQTATRNISERAAAARPLPAPTVMPTVVSKPQRPAAMGDGAVNAPLVSEAVRKAMVRRIAQQGVKDAAVLAAMESVPRHFFLEPGLASQAYVDTALPIGYHQTISKPSIVARMIEVMREGVDGKLGRVLEIGTGCGYQAAVLAQVAGEVYSIERMRPLHELARSNLRALCIPNLRLHYGDGMLGLPQCAPFDGIILAAAGLDVPQALLDQMALGGRLIAPVGQRVQRLKLVVRTKPNEWVADLLEPCHFVPMRPGTFG